MLSSRFLEMIVLTINEWIVIVNSLYPELIETLEEYSFKIVPVQHRHGRLFGGLSLFTLLHVEELSSCNSRVVA